MIIVNKKILVVLVGIAVLMIVVVIAISNGKDKKIGLTELSKNLCYDDSKQMIKDLPDKSVYISNGKIFIDDKNTKIDSSVVIDKKENVIINEVDVNGNKLVIRCSNGKEIPIIDLTNAKSKEKISNNKQEKSDDNEKSANNTDIINDGNKQEKDSADSNVEEYVDSCELVVGKKEASVGEKVAIPIEVKKNPGILGMTVSIEYDDEALELEDIKNGEAYENILQFTKPKILESGCICLWDAISIEKNDVKDGIIATLVFNVRSSAKKQTYPIGIKCSGNDVVNNNLESIEVIVKSGHINVKE